MKLKYININGYGVLVDESAEIKEGDIAIHRNDEYRIKYNEQPIICTKSNCISIQEHWVKIIFAEKELGLDVPILPNWREFEVEEAAEKWVFETNGHKWSNNDDTAGDNYGSFVEGAKWQAERMYSEEEVRKIVWESRLFFHKHKDMPFSKVRSAFSQWFEQFKKKQ